MTRQEQWRILDRLRRRSLLKNEFRRAILKSIVKNRTTSLIHRYKANFSFSHLPRRSSVTQVRNRCTVSGRTWNVIRKAQYSRFVFRNKSYFSYMPGVRRASW